MLAPKEVCSRFYTEVINEDNPLEGKWTCKCKKVIKQKKGSGYTNLIKHIIAIHNSEYEHINNQTEPTLDSFVHKKASICLVG